MHCILNEGPRKLKSAMFDYCRNRSHLVNFWATHVQYTQAGRNILKTTVVFLFKVQKDAFPYDFLD